MHARQAQLLVPAGAQQQLDCLHAAERLTCGTVCCLLGCAPQVVRRLEAQGGEDALLELCRRFRECFIEALQPQARGWLGAGLAISRWLRLCRRVHLGMSASATTFCLVGPARDPNSHPLPALVRSTCRRAGARNTSGGERLASIPSTASREPTEGPAPHQCMSGCTQHQCAAQAESSSKSVTRKHGAVQGHGERK